MLAVTTMPANKIPSKTRRLGIPYTFGLRNQR